MAFQLFESRRRGNSPRISVRATGVIAFNRGAIHRYAIEKGKFVQLYFDPDTRQIGMRITSDSTAQGAINVVWRNEMNAWLSAKPFFDFHALKLPPTRSLRLDPELRDDGMVVVQYPKQDPIAPP